MVIRVRARKKGIRGYLQIHRSNHYNKFANIYPLNKYSRNNSIVLFGLDILSKSINALRIYIIEIRNAKAIGCTCESEVQLMDPSFVVDFSKDTDEFIDIHTVIESEMKENCHGDFLIELNKHLLLHNDFKNYHLEIIPCYFIIASINDATKKSNLCWTNHPVDAEYVFKSGGSGDPNMYITCRICFENSHLCEINPIISKFRKVLATSETLENSIYYPEHARHKIIK